MLETAVVPGVHLVRLQLLPILGSGESWVDQGLLVGQPIKKPRCVIGGLLPIEFTWMRVYFFTDYSVTRQCGSP